jgi:hypothetical protein
LQATQKVLTGTPPVAGDAFGGTEAMISLALERTKKGLAPPREVYLAPYRNQIDWTAFPDWAKPNDPDMFEGCSHEG